MAQEYAIFDRSTKMWVAGFDEQFGCVVVATHPARAKRFPTEAEAATWAADHWDAGYGMSAAHSEVRPAPRA